MKSRKKRKLTVNDTWETKKVLLKSTVTLFYTWYSVFKLLHTWPPCWRKSRTRKRMTLKTGSLKKNSVWDKAHSKRMKQQKETKERRSKRRNVLREMLGNIGGEDERRHLRHLYSYSYVLRLHYIDTFSLVDFSFRVLMLIDGTWEFSQKERHMKLERPR